MRVLQVEDDATTARTVELMLRSEGHDCETTCLGEEAVTLAQENDYDLILLDIMLPDIDGYDVLKHLRENDVQTPILMQSALIADERDSAAFGLSDCLVKPFGKQELITRIESATGIAQARISDVAADAPHAPGRERRREPRIKTNVQAEILHDGADRAVKCLILSFSEGGAAIQPPGRTEMPDRFTLRTELGPTYECEVRWRHGDKLGVCFLDN